MLRVKGWSDFQHYKDRRPPWIKLHRELLENFKWHKLTSDSKALAICIWILACEHEDPEAGLVSDNAEELSFRARMDEKVVFQSIKQLIQHGFLEHQPSDASDLLAPCYQLATPETETEAEAESYSEETETDSVSDLKEIELAIKLWNDLCKKIGTVQCQKVTAARRASLRKRLKDCGGIEGWKSMIEIVENNPFFIGDNNRGWKANIDFILKEGKFTKIMEGGYNELGKRKRSDTVKQDLQEWVMESR